MSGAIANPGGRERVVERGLRAFQLRKEGRTVQQIAEILGVSDTTVSADIKAVREELRESALALAEEERDVMVGQCKQMIAKFAPIVLDDAVPIMVERDGMQVLNADRIEAMSKAAAVILKAQERLAKVLGLDAPEKLDANVNGRFVADADLLVRTQEASPLVAALGGLVEKARARVAQPAAIEAEVKVVPAPVVASSGSLAGAVREVFEEDAEA